MNIINLAAGVVFSACALTTNSYAMRCGTHLVNEGDSAIRMLELCGTPTQDGYSNIMYLNKDGDGMNYYVHVNGAGMIDSISASRGGL